MMILTHTEENYLKGLFHLTVENDEKEKAGTNQLANYLQLKPATVNDMLKKLRDKKLIHYEKYGKITLTSQGKFLAIQVIRKHRLWETFLYEKLDFTWDEVHEVAEQLEHIQSEKLILQLEKFLEFPSTDPHGDAIPNAKGELKLKSRQRLSDIKVGDRCKLVAIKDTSATFLQYVVKIGLGLSSEIKVVNREEFDGSMEIIVEEKQITVSERFANHIFVKVLKS